MDFVKFVKKNRKFAFVLMDVIIIIVAYITTKILLTNISLLLDINILKTLSYSILAAVVVYELLLNLFSVYKNMVRYENGTDYLIYIFLCFCSCCIICISFTILKNQVLDVKTNFIAAILIASGIVAYRIIVRMILNKMNANRYKDISDTKTKKRLLLIGAGISTKNIIKTIRDTVNDQYTIIGIIDDNKNKLGYNISSVRVIGQRKDIEEICSENKIDTIFFTITQIDAKNKKDILEHCQNTGAKLRILPSTEAVIKNNNIFSKLRDVEIEDILYREPILLDNTNITEIIENNVVLVTGGGGSIGSELCRQLVKYNPQKLIILDIYENNLYNIELELKSTYMNTAIEAIVASVRDEKRLDEIFKEYRPAIVFHAAAHKHVPLMENNPFEAIKNNVFGTYNLTNCCDKYHTKKFVLISTDKAVNPTNVMGATKRLCEMIVQARNKSSQTEFVAVRFGNVLGSNGSVVPLFKKQIAEGGPITVTDKEITRFFMTIPEAAQLVIQAITYAKGGEIFVLDMGEPIKIYDLAEKLIKLSGYELGKEIQIKITGLRPGEKLYEELLMAEEGLQKTEHNKIFVAKPMNITMEEVDNKLKYLTQTIKDEHCSIEKFKTVLKEVVPTYTNKAHTISIK